MQTATGCSPYSAAPLKTQARCERARVRRSLPEERSARMHHRPSRRPNLYGVRNVRADAVLPGCDAVPQTQVRSAQRLPLPGSRNRRRAQACGGSPVKAQTIAQAADAYARRFHGIAAPGARSDFAAGAAFVLDALQDVVPCGDSVCRGHGGTPESQATPAAHEIGWRKSGHPYIRPRWLTTLIAALTNETDPKS